MGREPDVCKPPKFLMSRCVGPIEGFYTMKYAEFEKVECLGKDRGISEILSPSRKVRESSGFRRPSEASAYLGNPARQAAVDHHGFAGDVVVRDQHGDDFGDLLGSSFTVQGNAV